MNRRKVMNSLIFLLLAIFSIVTLFPIIWTAITSLKTVFRCLRSRRICSRIPATLSHYKEVIMGNFPAYIRNSMHGYIFQLCNITGTWYPGSLRLRKIATEKTKPVFAAVTAVRMVPPVAHGNSFFPDHP